LSVNSSLYLWPVDQWSVLSLLWKRQKGSKG